MSGEYDPRITAYFGDAVLRAGFMPIPHLFMRHYRRLGLSSNQAMFLMQVMESAWDLADPPRTVGDLARRMDIDPRTIRKYSEEVARLQLIRLYDQYDTNGAQVENGYDLSPLFQRLALFAPEALPGQATRRRYLRGEAHDELTSATVKPTSQASIPAENSDPPPQNKRSSPQDRPIRPTPDRTITRPWIKRSRLNKELRSFKNHERTPIQHHTELHEHTCTIQDVGVVVQGTVEDAPTNTQFEQPGDQSLRQGNEQSAKDVALSQMLLDRAGLNGTVAAAVAPTLTHAEIWSLRTYARAARLGPGWIATQVYDFARRQPRRTDLSSRYAAVGDLLAALNPTVAELIIDHVDTCCPHAPDALQDTDITGLAAMQAAEAVWLVMADLRSGASSLFHRTQTMVSPLELAVKPSDNYVNLWQMVCARLQHELPASVYKTWFVPSMLLDLAGEVAVIGTPNVFVRDEIASTYCNQLTAALAAEVGRPLQIEVVVDLNGTGSAQLAM